MVSKNGRKGRWRRKEGDLESATVSDALISGFCVPGLKAVVYDKGVGSYLCTSAVITPTLICLVMMGYWVAISTRLVMVRIERIKHGSRLL